MSYLLDVEGPTAGPVMSHTWLYQVMPTVHAKRTRPDGAPENVHACLCPGCEAWQVECRYWEPDETDDDSGSDWFDHYARQMNMLEDAAREHRIECPPFDMLAGLRGVAERD